MNFEKIAAEYNIELHQCQEDHWCRNGAHSVGNQIFMHPCDKDYIYELSFWHELGHVFLGRLMEGCCTHHLCTMSNEGAAWELGFIEAGKHGRSWDYNSKEMKWCRKQIATYVNGEYDDLKEYYKERNNDRESNRNAKTP